MPSLNSPGRRIVISLVRLALPMWPYSSGWHYYPGGRLGILVVIVLCRSRAPSCAPHLRSLAAACAAKETFWSLYDRGSAETAAAHLDAWEAGLAAPLYPYFRKVTAAIATWREEILAYWTTEKPVTNGPAQGLNAQIKRIQAAGGGSLPFSLLRARVLYGEAARRARAERRNVVRRKRCTAA